VILWRISNYADLSGTGGVLHPGRWHHRGRPIVYLAESPAAALLEVLVHVQVSHPGELPAHYQLMEIALPDGVRSFNRLFNPLHPQAQQAVVVSVAQYPFDERLARLPE
jgi:RES domain-containing protein